MAKAAKRKAKTQKTPGGAASGERMRRSSDPVEAMLLLVAAEGWRAVSLGRIATACGLSLSDLYGRYASKTDLLIAYAKRIDAAMLEALGPMPAEAEAAAVKDRLFEAIMARLDALAPHKAAVRVLMRELPADPAALMCFLYGGLRRGIDWTLAAAELDSPGLAGILRRKVLGAIYLDTLRVWLRDESADMETTMAHLDKRLRQAMNCLNAGGFLSRLRRNVV
ncbi:MAG TPA: TetR family transcriptional regulator [Ferrovibrio sp.]|uniref:TetR family transcriptional regulator n=1 Tax=Ferrovibrio sp. TaxID=1917215 RepID=UPI002ED504FE